MFVARAAFRRGCILAVAAIAAFGAFAAGHGRASAGPVCTINWTGGGGDRQWQTADNWDTAQVPAATDHPLLPSATTEQVAFTGTASVAGVKALGPKFITTGNLTLPDTSQPS